MHSGTGADLYVRWSNVAADPNVTSGERTCRQGSDRPCAGLRWPRTANSAFGQSLHMPSALYDAHPLWRTRRIWTVIDIEVVSQHASCCRRDDGTAHRSTASVAGTGADDDPSSRRRPSHSSSRSNVRSNSRRGRALGYRATRTSADGRALRLVFCCSKSDPRGVEPTDWSRGDVRRTSRRCRRAAAPGPVWQPIAVLFEQGVGQQEELAHDGGQSDLRRFPLAAELAVLRTQVRVATDRRQGRHVEKPPHPRPAALDEAAALPGAGLARDRGETGQAGNRLGIEAAEFRHLGEQARRGDARHARDRGQDLGPAGQYPVFGQPLADFGIDGGQMPVNLGQPPCSAASAADVEGASGGSVRQCGP